MKGFLREQLRLAVFYCVAFAVSLPIMFVWTRLGSTWTLFLFFHLGSVELAILLCGLAASAYLSLKIFALIGVPLDWRRVLKSSIRRIALMVATFLAVTFVCFISVRLLFPVVAEPLLNAAPASPVIRFIFGDNLSGLVGYLVIAYIFIILLPGFEAALVVRRALGWANAE